MKRMSKIIIKKNNVIKAILDIDGKILTDDRSLRNQLTFLLKQDLVVPTTKGKSVGMSYEKITNEGQLFLHLSNHLTEDGYRVE